MSQQDISTSSSGGGGDNVLGGSPPGTTPTRQRTKVSSACAPCRRTKRKCDGQMPCTHCVASNAAQACVYDPASDGRRIQSRKRAYENSKRDSLEVIIQCLRNADDRMASEVFARIRRRQTLEELVEYISDSEMINQGRGASIENDITSNLSGIQVSSHGTMQSSLSDAESELWTDTTDVGRSSSSQPVQWSSVTNDYTLLLHLINVYFCWLHHIVPVMSKRLFMTALQSGDRRYCSPLLVNAMCAAAAFNCVGDGSSELDHHYRDLTDQFTAEAENMATEAMTQRDFSITSVQALSVLCFVHLQTGAGTNMWNCLNQASVTMQNLGLDRPAYGEGLTLRSKIAHIAFWGLLMMDRLATLVRGRAGQLRTSSRPPKPSYEALHDRDVWVPVSADPSFGATTTMRPERAAEVITMQCDLFDIFDDVHTSYYLQGQPLKVVDINSLYRRLTTLWESFPAFNEYEAPPALFHLMSVYHAMILVLFRPFIRTTNKSFAASPASICTEAAYSIVRLHVQQQHNFGTRCWNICSVNHLSAAAWVFASDLSNSDYLQSFVQCLDLLQAMQNKLQIPIENAFTSMFPFLKRWKKLTSQVWHACMDVVPYDKRDGALGHALAACSPASTSFGDAIEATNLDASFAEWLDGGYMTAIGSGPFLHLDDLDFSDSLASS